MRPDDAITGLDYRKVVSWITANCRLAGWHAFAATRSPEIARDTVGANDAEILAVRPSRFRRGPPSYILISSCRSYVEPLLTEAELRTTKSGASIMLWDCFGGLSSHAGRVQL